MAADPERFKGLVRESLQRHVTAIRKLTESSGLSFWDYGNAFLLESKRAGAAICSEDDESAFIYPSYVQDIMG